MKQLELKINVFGFGPPPVRLHRLSGGCRSPRRRASKCRRGRRVSRTATRTRGVPVSPRRGSQGDGRSRHERTAGPRRLAAGLSAEADEQSGPPAGGGPEGPVQFGSCTSKGCCGRISARPGAEAVWSRSSRGPALRPLPRSWAIARAVCPRASTSPVFKREFADFLDFWIIGRSHPGGLRGARMTRGSPRNAPPPIGTAEDDDADQPGAGA